MSIRRRCAAFSTSFLLACGACASTPAIVTLGSDGLPRSASKGFVVLQKECLINKDTTPRERGGTFGAVVLAIADTIIPTITSYLFDLAVKNAKVESLKRASSTSATSDGDLQTTFYRTADMKTVRNFGCVMFIRPPRAGATVAPEFATAFNGLWANRVWREDIAMAFAGVELGPTEYPEIYAELLVEAVTVSDGTAAKPREIGFRLVPATLAFGISGARVSGAQKDVTLNVSITGATVNEKGFSSNPVYTASYVFEGLPVGTAVKLPRTDKDVLNFSKAPDVLRGKAGPVVAVPPSAIKTKSPEGKDVDVPFDVPLVATVVETETEAGSELTRQILAAIEKNKDSILKPVDTRLKDIVKEVVGEDANK